jgi:hypothetical protein
MIEVESWPYLQARSRVEGPALDGIKLDQSSSFAASKG